MSKSVSIPSRTAAKLQRVTHTLSRAYRRLRLRNAIVSMRAPKPVERFPADGRRFVIFLVPGGDLVNGGIMSICSIAVETRKLLGGNCVLVAVCTALSEPRLLRYTKFDNDIELFAFADMLAWLPSGSEVLVHVPELCVRRYICDHIGAFCSRSDLKWRFNILLQNIDRIPPKNDVDMLQQLGFTTATINHKASIAAADALGCPTHYLSWFISAGDFRRVKYFAKKKLIAISPDLHPAKAEIVRRIRDTLPDHKVVEIRKMTYQQYKSLIREAKFMFTFGEGLDGYFVESIFSGTVAMAIFEERFFTPEYRGLPGVFRDAETAVTDAGAFLQMADSAAHFDAVAEHQYEAVAQTFRRDVYQNNVRTFYAKYFPEWSLPPVGDERALSMQRK